MISAGMVEVAADEAGVANRTASQIAREAAAVKGIVSADAGRAPEVLMNEIGRPQMVAVEAAGMVCRDAAGTERTAADPGKVAMHEIG